MTAARPVSITTAELKQRLAFRFDAKEYALFWEVGNGTGSNTRRHIDALAVSLWPSRGLTISGFEMKASRTDWLKELKNPAKAEAIAKYCDYFYLVAASPSIVQPGELPETWGMLVPNGPKGLKAIAPAAKLDSVPLDRSFVAAIARRACAWEPAELTALKMSHAKALRDEYAKGYDAGVKRADPSYAELQKLRNQMLRFEELTGIDVGKNWRPDDWPEKVAAGINAIRRQPTYHAQTLRELAATLSTVATAVDAGFDFNFDDTPAGDATDAQSC